MKTHTSLPHFPVEELNTVIGYSEENEKIRQAIITGSWKDELDSDLGKLCFDVLGNLRSIIHKLAESKSESYAAHGGSWLVDEHGMLLLFSPLETLDCTCSNFGVEASEEEFSFGLGIIAANVLACDEDAPSEVIDYFTYLYHLSHCIYDIAPETETFNKTTIFQIFD